MMVLGVGLEVFLKILDTPAQNGNLHFWRARVRFVDPELRNHFGLCFSRQHSEIDTPRLVLTDLFLLQDSTGRPGVAGLAAWQSSTSIRLLTRAARCVGGH